MLAAWIGIAAAVLLVSLLVNGFLLWLSCLACRVRRPERVSFKRALAVAGVVFVGNLAILAGLARTGGPSPADPWLRLAWSLVIELLFLLVCFRFFLSPTTGKAALVVLLWGALSALFAVALVPGIKLAVGEAYVVPTGAMADTIWGYHKKVICPACGLTFAVNASGEAEPGDGLPAPVLACTCPNCRQHIHFPNAPRRLLKPGSVEVPEPKLEGGDRLFCASGLLGRRQAPVGCWDLVVFDYPGNEWEPHSRGSMKYIMRLVGLPGETIAIHGGNLYTLPPDKGPQWDDHRQAQGDPEKLSRLSYKSFMHVNSPEARRSWEASTFEVLRKPLETLLAMMRLVYDNDHPGKDLSSGKALPERWAGDGWQAEGRGFRSDGKGDKPAWLRYSHLPNRDKLHQRELITDLLGYNTYVNAPLHWAPHQPPGQNWASDLILECEVTLPDNPSGELTLELSRGVDRFRARFDLASGRCTLLRDSGAVKELESKPTPLEGKGAYRLRFANVDQRLTLWVNDQLPFGDGVSYPAAVAEGPDAKNDLEPVSIGVRGAAVEVRKLKVLRDVYYTAGDSRPSDPDVSFDPGDPSTWEGLRHLPVLTLSVQPGHYLCLGDNSQESSDGRSWGSVPDRLLLGKAVLVYYPFGRAGLLR